MVSRSGLVCWEPLAFMRGEERFSASVKEPTDHALFSVG